MWLLSPVFTWGILELRRTRERFNLRRLVRTPRKALLLGDGSFKTATGLDWRGSVHAHVDVIGVFLDPAIVPSGPSKNTQYVVCSVHHVIQLPAMALCVAKQAATSSRRDAVTAIATSRNPTTV